VGWGQTPLTSGTVSEDFSTLSTAANNASTNIVYTNGVTVSGWYLATNIGPVTQYRVSDGASTSAGNHFSYGPAGDADRALGTMAASGTIRYIGWRLKNNSGSVITNITVSYVGEQWRVNNATAQTLAFGYLTGAGPLTD